MTRATNKQRRMKELEKHVAVISGGEARRRKRDEKLEKQDRVMEMANPAPGTTMVSSRILAATKKAKM